MKSNKLWRKLVVLPVFVFALAAGLFLVSSEAEAIDFGTAEVYSGTMDTSYLNEVAALDSSHFVVVYNDYNTGIGYAKIGTVSGNNITFGVQQSFSSGPIVYNGANDTSHVARIDDEHFVIAYGEKVETWESFGKAVIGTWNGLDDASADIEFGSVADIDPGSYEFALNVVGMTASDFVLVYEDNTNLEKGTAVVGRWDGQDGSLADISLGSETVFSNDVADYIDVKKLDDTHFITSYQDSGLAYLRVGTISGTSVTGFGTAVNWFTPTSGQDKARLAVLNYSGTPGSEYGKFVVQYKDGGEPYDNRAIVGTIDNTDEITMAANSYEYQYFCPYGDIIRTGDFSFIMTYGLSNTPRKGSIIKGSVAGDIITFETEEYYTSTTADYFGLAGFADFAVDKFVATYSDYNNGKYGTAVIGNYGVKSISIIQQQSAMISQTNPPNTSQIAVVQNNNNNLAIQYQSGGQVYARNNVVNGINSILARATVRNNHVFGIYSISPSPNQLHLFEYDAINDSMISDTNIYTGAFYNAAMAAEDQYNNGEVVLYGQLGDNLYMYFDDGGGYDSYDTGISDALDATMTITIDAGADRAYFAYVNTDLDIVAVEYNLATQTVVNSEDVVTALSDTPIKMRALPGEVSNSMPVLVWEDGGDYGVNVSIDTGSWTTSDTGVNLTLESKGFDAIQDPDNSAYFLLTYNNATNLVLANHVKTTGAVVGTPALVVSGASYDISPSLAGHYNDGSNDLAVMTIGQEDATGDNLFKYTETALGGFTEEGFEQEDDPAVPELPTNVIWKIVVALMAMGAVIGIAAIFRKRGITEAQNMIDPKKPATKAKAGRPRKTVGTKKK